MRNILIAIGIFLTCIGHAANPSFGDFALSQFATNGNKVAIKSGAGITNPIIEGPMVITGTLNVDGAINSTATIRGQSGQFTNSLTLNGSPVLTNAPGSGITNSGLTANTIIKATGTNSIGNSTITDDGFGGFTFGDAGLSEVAISIPSNPSGDGTDLKFNSGAPGVDGRGGDLRFTAKSGVGNGRGGNVRFTAGQGSGTGISGVILFEAPGDGGTITLDASGSGGQVKLSALSGSVGFDTDMVIPLGPSASLGTIAAQWSRVFAEKGIFTDGLTVTNNFALDGDLDMTGNATIRGVPYTWPAVQGGAGTMLVNDGTGVVTWEPTNSAGTTVSVNGTNVTTPNFTNSSTVTLAIGGGSNITATAVQDTSSTNIVTLTQTGTNVSQLNFALVARGGLFKLVLTGNAYIGNLANINNTDFKHCSLAVQQPNTGMCLVTFTNTLVAQPGGVALINDTNNGAVVWYEMRSNPFTNGIVDIWMSQRSATF